MSPALAGGFFSTERTGKQVRVPPLLFNSMVSGCTSHLNLSFYTQKVEICGPSRCGTIIDFLHARVPSRFSPVRLCDPMDCSWPD